MEIYNFHVESLPWTVLHLSERMAWSDEIIMYKTLRKFLSLGNLDFSSWLLTFLTSWWSSLIFLNVLMKFDLWNVILTKKSKFDFPVCNWPFCPCANSKPKLMYQCCKLDVLEYLVSKYLQNERANFGVQQLPLFNLLKPGELDWRVLSFVTRRWKMIGH